ncbi:O-antigen polymerase [Streptococcus suis]|uniref:O-antigen polymerase n=1 Tax=Streptococcus suis TaxID=1307 RepID=UPI001EE78FD3|nr:oligosaccharide repeat unit polymerase [Streptococcus suis]MCH1564599.1 oligosaccharide repeat unit polymerase [Streptococcus suis]MCH1629533.1 oligosaccharide repeat unit polymerase [Streptococcus suis]HEM6497557.1 oligosaccharide repeat unit polymerase [Streptococcus suis]
MSFLYILLLGLCLLFILTYIFSNRDILSPSVVMTLVFIVSTVFAILNIRNWEIDYNVSAGLITLSGIFVFFVSEMMGNIFWGKRVKGTTYLNFDFQEITIDKWKLYFLIIFNFFIVIWYFLKIRSIVGGGSIGEIFQEYRRIGVNQLEGKDVETVGGIINQFLKIVEGTGYVAGFTLINNYIYKSKKWQQNVMLVILIGLSILPGLFGAGRTQVLKLLSSFAIMSYVIWQQKYGWNKVMSWKVLGKGTLAAFIGIPAFYYSLALLGRSTTRSLLDYSSNYLSSGMILFSKYIEEPVTRIMWGEESLPNILKVLHALNLSPASTSYNLEFRRLGIGYSNIYSFFRRPYHDFGLLGMYIFVALIALWFSFLYFGKIKYMSQSSVTSRWLLVYSYFYYWIISSSIIQYSVAYVSIGTILNLLVILLLYQFLIGNSKKIRLRLK